MKKAILLAVLFCVVPMAWAVETLDEKLSIKDRHMNYVPHRDAGHAAMDAGNYAEAIGHFRRAADSTAFTYVRSIHYGNIGLCYWLSAKKVGSKSDAKDAAMHYENALSLMNQADSVCGGGCVHVTDCTKKRSHFRGVFERMLAASKKLLK